jgi:hypothetical protein
MIAATRRARHLKGEEESDIDGASVRNVNAMRKSTQTLEEKHW